MFHCHARAAGNKGKMRHAKGARADLRFFTATKINIHCERSYAASDVLSAMRHGQQAGAACSGTGQPLRSPCPWQDEEEEGVVWQGCVMLREAPTQKKPPLTWALWRRRHTPAWGAPPILGAAPSLLVDTRFGPRLHAERPTRRRRTRTWGHFSASTRTTTRGRRCRKTSLGGCARWCRARLGLGLGFGCESGFCILGAARLGCGLEPGKRLLCRTKCHSPHLPGALTLP